MTQEPSVSVIIPMFNAQKWIQQTLTTVTQQTYPVEECIVVDDGSTDGSAPIVRRFVASTSVPIRLVQTANRGPSLALNTGIAESKGELVAFLDADDLWNPQKLELQVRLLSDAGAVACLCGYEIFDEASGRARGVVQTRDPPRAIMKWLAMEGHGFTGSTALFRREVVERLGGFDSVLGTGYDFGLFYRAQSLGLVVSDHHVLVGYRSHDAQMHRALGTTVENMKRVCDEIFSQEGDARLEQRCRANIDAHYGYNLLFAGQIVEGASYLRKSFRRDPRRIVTLPIHAIGRRVNRWLRARLSRRRFFDSIPS